MVNKKHSCSKCLYQNPAAITATTILHQFSESLGTAIDAKDPFTSLHSEEVAEIAHSIALSMGLGSGEADIIHIAGHLHDIGKIGVPDAVLKKAGPLNEKEWQFIKKHPDTGANILRPVASLMENGIVDMVRHHHERYDGKGYPCGLKGKAIPLGARVIALADSLSAILQNRPYRPSRDFDWAFAEIVNCSGNQFDPDVVRAFMGVSEKISSLLKFLNPEQGEVA